VETFGLVLGSSGSGKGTRMNQLIKFLETKYRSEVYKTTYNDKIFDLGIYFKDLDLLFLGKYTNNKKAGYVSWASFDSLWSKFGGTEPTVDYIKHLKIKNVIGEGYSNMDTFRVRPKHMSSNGCKKFFYQIYYYGKENFDKYIDRIVERSGKPPKGTTAFEKEGAILGFYDKIKRELEEFEGYAKKLPFNADITSLGYDYLKFLELNELAEEFLEYSKNNKHFKKFQGTKLSDWDF